MVYLRIKILILIVCHINIYQIKDNNFNINSFYANDIMMLMIKVVMINSNKNRFDKAHTRLLILGI